MGAVATSVYATKPMMQFSTTTVNKLCVELASTWSINDCDCPLAPTFEVVNVTANAVWIEYNLNKKYYSEIGKPLLKIGIEYAMVNSDDNLWNEFKEEENEKESNSDSDS